MELLFYILILMIIVSVATGLIQTFRYRYLIIDPAELPEVVSLEIENYFSALQPVEIMAQQARNRYRIDGRIESEDYRLTIDLTPDQDLATLQLSRCRNEHRFNAIQQIVNAAVPQRLAEVIQRFLTHENVAIGTTAAYMGVIGDENGYRLIVPTERFSFRFDLTAEGQMVQMYKRSLNH